MPVKLILRWDIQPEKESEYFEFLVHEFIPSLNKMGIEDILVWYTAYGECEQKMAEGTTRSQEEMRRIVNSDRWQALIDKLDSYVTSFTFKAIPATQGFQL